MDTYKSFGLCGKHGEEELGWNTAFGNSMALMFVSLYCLRYISGLDADIVTAFSSAILRTLTSLFVLVYAFALLFLNFFHRIPKWVSFFISASLPINLITYVTRAVVYTGANVDFPMVIASLSLFIILFLFFKLLRLASTGCFLPKDLGLDKKEKVPEKPGEPSEKKRKNLRSLDSDAPNKFPYICLIFAQVIEFNYEFSHIVISFSEE